MTRLLPLLLVLAACGPDADLETADLETADLEAADPAPTETADRAVEADGDRLFGDPVPSGDALSPDELIGNADEYAGKSVTVEGTVREVCQMEGCWLTLADGQGRTVRVGVPRDEADSYAYTFPTDANGATVRMIGLFEVETESVEDQRHYAQDGGASAADLEAITEPRESFVLTALGAELEPSGRRSQPGA